MVLEFKIPHGTGIHALRPLVPIGLTYILSFSFLGIYWNNHHHLLQATERVNGKVLWANLHLLFWLSLIPVTTGWMGENGFAPLPTAFYGIVLLADGTAYYILERTIVANAEANSRVLCSRRPPDQRETLDVHLRGRDSTRFRRPVGLGWAIRRGRADLDRS